MAEFSQPGTCYFLQLPVEIRDLIYDYLLVRGSLKIAEQGHGLETPFQLRSQVVPQLFPPNYFCLIQDESGRLSPQVLRVCRRIFSEASKALYSKNVFTLSSDPLFIYTTFFPSLEQKYNDLVEHIAMDLGTQIDSSSLYSTWRADNIFPRWVTDEDNIFDSAKRYFPNLKRLEVRFHAVVSSETPEQDFSPLLEEFSALIDFWDEPNLFSKSLDALQQRYDDTLLGSRRKIAEQASGNRATEISIELSERPAVEFVPRGARTYVTLGPPNVPPSHLTHPTTSGDTRDVIIKCCNVNLVAQEAPRKFYGGAHEVKVAFKKRQEERMTDAAAEATWSFRDELRIGVWEWDESDSAESFHFFDGYGAYESDDGW